VPRNVVSPAQFVDAADEPGRLAIVSPHYTAMMKAREDVMTAGSRNHYIELTTRLRSIEAFCDFLSHGGSVRTAASDGAPFRDATVELYQRQRREADALKRERNLLYPQLADEDFQPPLYTSH